MLTSVFKVFPSIGKSLEGTGGRFPEDFHLNPSGVVSMTLIEVLLIMLIGITRIIPTINIIKSLRYCVDDRSRSCSSSSSLVSAQFSLMTIIVQYPPKIKTNGSPVPRSLAGGNGHWAAVPQDDLCYSYSGWLKVRESGN